MACNDRCNDPRATMIDPQQAANILADPTASPSLRIAALHLLDRGATEFHHLRLHGCTAHLSAFSFAVVRHQAQQGAPGAAAESLCLFTGLAISQCMAMVANLFAASSPGGPHDGHGFDPSDVSEACSAS